MGKKEHSFCILGRTLWGQESHKMAHREHPRLKDTFWFHLKKLQRRYVVSGSLCPPSFIEMECHVSYVYQ